MEFRILGPLEVHSDGEALDLGGAKRRALLAVLLLHANEVVSQDRLVDALWDQDPPATAQKALQVYVAGLRKLLGRNRVETRPPGYLLKVEDDEFDLARFRRLREQGKAAEALALWRGPPLADFAYQGFAQAEIGRLEDERLACLEERIERRLDAGSHAELTGELEALVAENPLRERLRGQLMIALYRSGRQADALEAYRQARVVLVEELGIEPGRQLRELQQAILNQDPLLEITEPTMEAAESDRGVFVGRGPELQHLLSAFDDASIGRGRLVLLVGEPGIGKSRLAEELVVQARARGAGILVGRCWEAGGAPAYWPWVQSLRGLIHETKVETLRTLLGAGAGDLAQLLPELREFFPDLPEPRAPESDSARFRLFEAASAFLKAAAHSRTLVLVLDDLHAADETSLLLLQFLARELGKSRLLVIGSFRNVDPTPTDPLTTAVTELLREPITTTIALGGLAEHDVRRFIELTAGESPTEKLVVAIHAETEGNPLFVGEIVRLLATEGGITVDPPRLGIPQSVRDVIARRLRHLSEECHRVLVLASVLGREFALDALARVANVSDDELLDALDEAMAAGVVSDVPGSPTHARFSHVLIRDTLYDFLTTARRVRLHRRVVEALEALYGQEPGPHLAELAYHCTAGSDFGKALRYASLAGDRAFALLAYEEAARLYQTALDSAELTGLTDERRHELLLLLGEAESRAGNTPAAKTAFLSAAEIARRLNLRQDLARAAAGYGGRIVWARAGDDDRLVPLLQEGLAALADDEVELRARLSARLAGALRDEHSRERREVLSSEAVELARRSGDLSALAYAIDGRSAAILAPDTLAECLALGTELRELAERIGDPERIVAGHFHRHLALLLSGDIRLAEEELDAMARFADELRQPAQLWLVYVHRSLLALSAGRFDEAEELLPRVLELGRGELGPRAIPAYRLQRSFLLEARGNLEEMEPDVRDLVATYPARPVFRCALARLHARIGRKEAAKRVLDDLASEDFSALPFDLEWLFGAALLAETCFYLNDGEAAEKLYRLLLPWKHLMAVDPPEGNLGSLARHLGLLASVLQRWDEAAQHYEDALATNERIEARPWVAQTQEEYAGMLLDRSDPGDKAGARRLLNQARSTYEKLGMTGQLKRVDRPVSKAR
jgi:DNA-binding SARP family transcriptional activator